MEDSDTFQQMSAIWADVIPKDQLKRYMALEGGDREKRHKGLPHDPPREESTSKVPSHVIQMMMTLLLRHEDSLRCIQLDMEYIIHLNIGEGSILPEMMMATKSWQTNKDKDVPLRHHLVCTMVTILQTRFQKLMEAAEDSPLKNRMPRRYIYSIRKGSALILLGIRIRKDW